jgi:Protein of unknown function (DUF3052)
MNTSSAPPAGYSGTPLVKKLGIKASSELCILNAPDNYAELIAPLPEGVRKITKFAASADLVHLFVSLRADLEATLTSIRPKLKADGAIWVSWPKKASKAPTDITEDTIRAVALPMGFVDIKVCAVDEKWSGLKLVIRKALR